MFYTARFVGGQFYLKDVGDCSVCSLLKLNVDIRRHYSFLNLLFLLYCGIASASTYKAFIKVLSYDGL